MNSSAGGAFRCLASRREVSREGFILSNKEPTCRTRAVNSVRSLLNALPV